MLMLGGFGGMPSREIFKFDALRLHFTVKLETLASGNIGEFGESWSNRQT